MKSNGQYLLTALFIVILCFASALQAGDSLDHDQAADLRKQGLVLPLEKILTAAKRLHQGRVIEVELEEKRGQYVYEIEIVDADGRVWEMKFNGSDARLLSEEQDD